MRILVTGGTGFLGRHVVWQAAGDGLEVVFTGRDEQAARQVMALSPRPVEWVYVSHGTSGAESILNRAAKNADGIVHCAALAAPWGCAGDFQRANVASTREVVQVAEKQGVRRLVHISTSSLYFDYSDQFAIRESQPYAPPANDYVRTKIEAERLVLSRPEGETVVIRPRAIFGPWDQVLAPRLLRVMSKGRIPLMRGGQALIDLTYIDNAVAAIMLALTRSLPHTPAIYNVTNGEPRAVRDVLSLMSDAFGIPARTRRVPWPVVDVLARALEARARMTGAAEPVVTRYSAAMLAYSQTLDITAISRDLGYTPAIGIDEGIRRHADWWRNRSGREGR